MIIIVLDKFIILTVAFYVNLPVFRVIRQRTITLKQGTFGL